MQQVFKVFFGAQDTRPVLVLVCLLIAGTLEAIGVGTLLPVLGTLLNSAGGHATAFETYLRSGMAWIGLTADFDTLLVIAVSFLLLRSVILFGASSYAGIMGARVSNNIRKRLIKAVFDARWSFHADQSSGRIASVISNDATRSGEAYNLAAVAASYAIQILSYVLIALLINPPVAFFAILGGLVLAVLSRQLIKHTHRAAYKQSDRTAMLTADMVELFHNLKSLKAMNRYDSMIEGLSALVKRLRRTLYTQYLTRYGMIYGNDFITVAILAVAAWFAIKWAGIPAEQLMVIGVLFFQVMSYISKFLKQVQQAIQVEASYTRAQQMIDAAEQQKEESFGTLPPPSRQDFTFENVNFAHGAKPVLIDATLTIPADRITVLQGPSGAGKTTLIDLLIGLLRPQSGTIRIGDQLLNDTDIMAFRSKLGYVQQELGLFHDSIRENITLSEKGISDDDIHEALRLAGAEDFISSLPQGLDTDVGEFGGKLSGGQRQRISLARAMVRKPEVLVLDEVTSALDPETELAIVENIANMRGRFTIIAITHRPAWTRIADVQYTFLGGRVSRGSQPSHGANTRSAAEKNPVTKKARA